MTLILASEAVAEIGISSGSRLVPVLHGEISKQDLSALRQNPRLRSGLPIILELDSEGGDWQAALDVGRLLRSTGSTALVNPGRNCLSACVLVLAGATGRIVMNGATVGIHRPYSTSTDKHSYAEAQARYRALESNARTYLREMNIPESLFDAMVRVPAERIRILTPTEVEDFGLSVQDPVAAEIEDADGARKYGLDRQTYLARKRQAGSCSRLFPSPETPRDVALERAERYDRCRESILRTGAWDGR